MKKIRFVVFIFLLVILSEKIHSQTSTGYWYINFHEPQWGGTYGNYKFCGANLTLADGTNIFYDQYDYDFLNSTHNIRYYSRPSYLSIYGTCSTCTNYGLLFEEDLSQLSAYTVYRYDTPLCDGYADGWGMEMLWYPKGPTSISLAPNYSNVYNENDDVEWVVTFPAGSKKVTRWKRKVGNGSWQNIYPYKIPGQDRYMDNLSNLNVSESVTVTYRVYTYDTGIQSEDYAQSIPITVYPRRPVIQSWSAGKPSCYKDGDGTININYIDGAYGVGVVDAYKITVAKGECPDLEQGDLNDVNQNNIMPFSESNGNVRYIYSNTNIGFTVDDFFQDPNQNGYTNPIISGTYCILLENAYVDEDGTSALINGHTFTEIFVNEKDSLYASVPNSDVECYGNTNGELLLTVDGGNPYYDAYLYNSEGTKIDSIINLGYQGGATKSESHTFNNLAVGNYDIQIIDNNNCNVYVSGVETDSDMIENISITQPDILSSDLIDTTHVLCKYENTGVLYYNISGGTKFSGDATKGGTKIGPYYRYSLSGEENGVIISDAQTSGNLTIDNLASDRYTLSITDANSCNVVYDVNPIEISEPNEKLSISNTSISDYSGYEIDCYGYETGIVSIKASGGNGKYYYSINDRQNFNPDNDNTFEYLPAGMYKFYITDASYDVLNANHCLDSVSVTLVQPADLEIDTLKLNHYFGNNNIKCHGGTDTVFVTTQGGIDFKDYYYYDGNDSTGTSNIISNLFQGPHDIIVKDDNGCRDTIQVVLEDPDSDPEIASIDTVSYNGFGVSCYGGSNGIFTVHPDMNKGTITDGKYFTFSIDSTGTQEPFRDDSVYSGLSEGIYSFKIKDANGCPSIDSYMQIDQPSQVSFSVSKKLYGTYHIKCKGESNGSFSMFPSGGIDTMEYEYYVEGANIGNDTIFDLSVGFYSTYVKDANGCDSETQSIELKEPEEITFSFETDTTYHGNHAIRCFGLTDSVKVKAFGGYVPDNYQSYLKFDSDSVYKPINPDDSAYFLITANTSYGLKIIDQNNCIKEEPDLFTPTEPDDMILLFKDTVPTLCHNTADGKLNARWSGGTSSFSNTYDYYLKQGNSIVQNLNDISVNDTATFVNLQGETEYRVFALDDNACLDSSLTTFITSPEVLEANSVETEQPPCFGDTEGNFIISGTGGTHTNNIYDFYIKTSYGDSVYISQTETATFDDVNLGTHNYFILDDNNCISDSAEFIIDDPDEMLIDFETTNVSSQGGTDGSATADVTGGTLEIGNDYSYKWRDAFDNILPGETDNSIIGYPAGDYSVEVWDDNDCPYGNSNTGLLQYVTIFEPGQAFELFVVQLHNASAPGNNDGSVTLGSQWRLGAISV
jgi:hypothetical protein